MPTTCRTYRNNDFGDAETVTTRALRDRLSEIVGRCDYGGERFV